MSELQVYSPPDQMSLEPKSFEEAWRFAEIAAKSDMVPKNYQDKPENVLVAVQMGRRVGIGAMQSVQNIANINGIPAMYGDLLLAICLTHSSCVDVVEKMTGTGDNMAAHCMAQRHGRKLVSRSFSIADAKTAGLWQGMSIKEDWKRKQSPWVKYPKRMLQMRARSWALRDTFPDVLQGLGCVEELREVVREDGTVEQYSVEGVTIPVEIETKPSKTDNLKSKLRKSVEDAKESEYDKAVAGFQGASSVEELKARSQEVDTARITEDQARELNQEYLFREEELAMGSRTKTTKKHPEG